MRGSLTAIKTRAPQLGGKEAIENAQKIDTPINNSKGFMKRKIKG